MDYFDDYFVDPIDDPDVGDPPPINTVIDPLIPENPHEASPSDPEKNDDMKPKVPDNVLGEFGETTNPDTDEQIDILSPKPHPALGKILGSPDIDSKHWHPQERGDSCAIVSQRFILESFYPDKDFTESELVENAELEGYYTPGGGTYLQDVGALLEDYGIDVERSYSNSLDDIKEKLNANKKIIVALDANEIWTNSIDEILNMNMIDLIAPLDANHAVEIIGFDTDKQEIILNDPGHHNGRSMRIPVDQFQLAWNDSNNFLMSTVDSPPMMTA